MKSKLAYIDHRMQFVPKTFLDALQNAEIDFKLYNSFEEFFKENDLREFPVMICHPGLNNQGKLSEIISRFPHLKLGLISFTEYEYMESDVPAFSYNLPNSVIKWVKENQFISTAKPL